MSTPSRRVSEPTFIAHHRKSDGATQALADHLLGVGELSARHAAKVKRSADDSHQLGPGDLAAVGELIGLLHDLGKYSRSFQTYLRSAVGLIDQDADEFVDAAQIRGRIDHSTAGAQYVWQRLETGSAIGRLASQMLVLCIASHHSGLIDCIVPAGDDNFSRRVTKPDEATHLQEALSNLDAAVAERVECLLAEPGIVGALEDVARSIGAKEARAGGSDVTVQMKLGLLTRFLFSCLVDADRADTASFERPNSKPVRDADHRPAWSELVARLETHLVGLHPTGPVDEIRKAVSDRCRDTASRPRGIFTLTVPTGGGKTLASLLFALRHAERHGLDRVIYVIPFTSIIDQNADLMRRVLDPASGGDTPGYVVLEHHSNLLPDEQTWQSKILAESWNAPVICTTSVQFLETLFGAGTRGTRRLHQLANAIVVFDEVQTIPLRCVHLFANAVNFLVDHCGSSVVLCTATQPLLAEVDAERGAIRCGGASELMPDVRRLFEALRRTRIVDQRRPGGWTDQDLRVLAESEVAAVGSCLVVVNTRRAAADLYEECRARLLEVPSFHLSTLMCPAHRREVLTRVRDRLAGGEPTLCISTQLIEAGIDVDFGAVIRHVAGLDSIAQAAGRCNRGGRRPTGRVHVVNPAEERIDRLVDIRVGRDVANRVLDEFRVSPAAFDDDLVGPKAISRYFDYYFFQRAEEMVYPVPPEIASRDDTLLNLLAGNRLAVEAYGDRHHVAPPTPLRQAFMTAAQAFQAIDAPTRGVVVPYGETGRDLVVQLCASIDPTRQFDLLRLAQQYSVNVFPQVFQALQQAGAVAEVATGTGVFHLHPEHYSPEFGLSESPVVSQETLNA
jgi:CRISPR-associated endonuclease/helicase Cas3